MSHRIVDNTISLISDNTTKSVSYQIPANETSVNLAGSKCSEKEDTLMVSWKTNNSFAMIFRANASKYDLSSFVIALNTSSLYDDSEGKLHEHLLRWDHLHQLLIIPANQTVIVSYANGSFDVPANFSYHCNRQTQLNATNGFLTVAKVQFEAFKADNTQKFSAAKDCDSNITPDIVPIAVGISLIALIVVVLVAYFVGRRRQQARGYLNIM